MKKNTCNYETQIKGDSIKLLWPVETPGQVVGCSGLLNKSHKKYAVVCINAQVLWRLIKKENSKVFSFLQIAIGGMKTANGRNMIKTPHSWVCVEKQ